jgi:hypothetical protein
LACLDDCRNYLTGDDNAPFTRFSGIIAAFLRSPYHDGIPSDELVMLDKDVEFSGPNVQANLKVYKRTLSGLTQ